MKLPSKIFRPPGAPAAIPERALVCDPRFTLNAKTGLPVVTSNRSFIRSWMARRAKLAVAAKARAAK